MQSLNLEPVNIYTVSQLTSEAKQLLEQTYMQIWVEGEISNFSTPNSGHWYFSLKDSKSQVRCAMFKGKQRKVVFVPKDGMHVLVKGTVTLFEGRGDFQIVLDDMEERGEGKLRRAYELLKKQLEREGLFDPRNKKPIPLFPKKVGLITSATGAAIRDILTVLKRRYAALPVIVYPTLVQGEKAANTIVKALEIANMHQTCDVLIIARGGGSLEDLWPFNEEIVAHAIFKSMIPIVSGVGHEVDFTIADFVADLRAATPTAAAELITPDQNELLQSLNRQQDSFTKAIRQFFEKHKTNIEWISKQLDYQHPQRKLTDKIQMLDRYEKELQQFQIGMLNQAKTMIKESLHKLLEQSPVRLLERNENKLNVATQRLQGVMQEKLSNVSKNIGNAAAKLDGLSPLATLGRGFALISKENRVLQSIKDVSQGNLLNVKLVDGNFDCVVTEKK